MGQTSDFEGENLEKIEDEQRWAKRLSDLWIKSHFQSPRRDSSKPGLRHAIRERRTKGNRDEQKGRELFAEKQRIAVRFGNQQHQRLWIRGSRLQGKMKRRQGNYHIKTGGRINQKKTCEKTSLKGHLKPNWNTKTQSDWATGIPFLSS